MRVHTIVAATLLLAVGQPNFASAQGPSFDCAKADGTVQKQICSDTALGALDRKLDEVYKAAVKKATGKMLATLRTEQRGWVKGRDECWKATKDTPSWITASWTVDSVKACIEANYKVRTSELQATWRLIAPKTVSYMCQNNPANEIVANFFETDPKSARLERGDKTKTVWLVTAPTGPVYEGQNVSFTTKGNDATASWMNEATGNTENLTCKVR